MTAFPSVPQKPTRVPTESFLAHAPQGGSRPYSPSCSNLLRESMKILCSCIPQSAMVNCMVLPKGIFCTRFISLILSTQETGNSMRRPRPWTHPEATSCLGSSCTQSSTWEGKHQMPLQLDSYRFLPG